MNNKKGSSIQCYTWERLIMGETRERLRVNQGIKRERRVRVWDEEVNEVLILYLIKMKLFLTWN